jgi:hypothetical protein
MIGIPSASGDSHAEENMRRRATNQPAARIRTAGVATLASDAVRTAATGKNGTAARKMKSAN